MSDAEERLDDFELELEIMGNEVAGLADEIDRTNKELNDVKAILALAISSKKEDQEKFKMLREAYEKYEFTKNLALGVKND